MRATKPISSLIFRQKLATRHLTLEFFLARVFSARYFRGESYDNRTLKAGKNDMGMIERSKSDLARSLQAAKTQMANIREKAEEGVKRGVSAGISVGAGYGVGYLYKEHPSMTKIAGTDVDSALAVGIIALGVGLTDMAGKQSDHVLAAGVGALTGYAALKGAGHA